MLDGAKIRTERRALGVSLCTVATLAKIDVGLLSRFETGSYRPSIAFQFEVRRVLHSLGVLFESLPYWPDRRDTNVLRDLLERMDRGEFEGYARLQSEKRETEAKIAAAGEAAGA